MNKIEFYNKLVDMYRSTGQGIATIFTDRIVDRSVVNELISDGLCKIVHQGFSYLPDEDWVCLTKVYCVEDDTVNKDSSALTYLRIYKGIDPPIELGNLGKMTLSQCIKNPEIMEPYAEWLKKNKVMLEKGDKIDYLEEDDLKEFSGDTITYIKERSWYKENKTVNMCIKEISKTEENIEKQFPILNELIMLMNSSLEAKSKYKNELIQHTQDIEDNKKELKLLARIKTWLSEQGKTKRIQSLI